MSDETFLLTLSLSKGEERGFYVLILRQAQDEGGERGVHQLPKNHPLAAVIWAVL